MSDRSPSQPPPSTPPSGSRPGSGEGESAGPARGTEGRPIPPPPPPPPPSAGGQGTRRRAGTTATGPTAGPSGGSGDTAVRPGFAERLQAKLSSATDEHRANAGAAPGAATPPPGQRSRGRGPRRARLRLTRLDPWSVMKTSFLLSIAFGIVTVVAVAMIWQVLGAAGVWDSINSTVRDVVDSPGTDEFDVRDYVGTSRVVGFTMLVAAVDVILLTAIATLGAFLYNMAAALLGGVEMTLAEDR